jgi:hypothetical protein
MSFTARLVLSFRASAGGAIPPTLVDLPVLDRPMPVPAFRVLLAASIHIEAKPRGKHATGTHLTWRLPHTATGGLTC